MKYLYLIVFVFIVNSAAFCQELKIVKKSQLKNPFKKLKYTKVIAYNFALKGSHEQYSIIKEDGKLDYTTVLPGRILLIEEVDSLITTLADTSTYGGGIAMCFEPRLAFVFYNDNSIVACIDVCFECNYLTSTISIPAKDYYNKNFDYGFSKFGRKRLIAFCRKLNMSYCVKDGESAFDE